MNQSEPDCHAAQQQRTQQQQSSNQIAIHNPTHTCSSPDSQPDSAAHPQLPKPLPLDTTTHMGISLFACPLLIVFFPALISFAQPFDHFPTSSPQTDEALDSYAALTHRTVLRPDVLPDLAKSALTGLPKDTNAAIAYLDRLFASAALDITRLGDKFVRVMPADWTNSPPVMDQLRRIGLPPASAPIPPAPASGRPGYIPAGEVNFPHTDILQVIQIYSDLRLRTILRAAVLPECYIRLRSQTAWTREESVYAITVACALNDVAIADDGDQFVQIVRLENVEEIKTAAPKPELGAPTRKPDEVPQLGILRSLSGESPQKFLLREMQAKPSTVDDFIRYYASLVGKQAAPSGITTKNVLAFAPQTPLTDAELKYGIETVLRLNGLAIETVGDHTIRAARTSIP